MYDVNYNSLPGDADRGRPKRVVASNKNHDGSAAWPRVFHVRTSMFGQRFFTLWHNRTAARARINVHVVGDRQLNARLLTCEVDLARVLCIQATPASTRIPPHNVDIATHRNPMSRMRSLIFSCRVCALIRG